MYQSTKYSKALIRAYNKQYKCLEQKTSSEANSNVSEK